MIYDSWFACYGTSMLLLAVIYHFHTDYKFVLFWTHCCSKLVSALLLFPFQPKSKIVELFQIILNSFEQRQSPDI